MKRSILFLIMFMCMISVSAFAVDYSHDKSPPGVEVYQATTVASIDFDNVWLVEIPAITQIGEIPFNLFSEVAIVEVIYIGDSYIIVNMNTYVKTELRDLFKTRPNDETEGLFSQRICEYPLFDAG